MFSFNPFHALTSSNKTPEDKNLTTYLESERKIGAAWLRLADDRRIAANHLKMFGHPLGDDLTVWLFSSAHHHTRHELILLSFRMSQANWEIY